MERTPYDNYWTAQFVREREHLIGALGEITEGGIVEQLEHVGATSVPGLLGRPCVDIALAVWPFPLDELARQTLVSLGYELDPDCAGATEQHFRHASRMFRLNVVEAGSPSWTEYVLVREYLRNDEATRQALSARKLDWDGSTESTGYREAKRAWLEQLLGEAHQSWIKRERFAPLHRVAQELREFPCAWHICGGWALDLLLGQVTRVHDDVDVMVPRDDQLALQQHMTARGWKLLTPFDGQLRTWATHIPLGPQSHQVHAHRDGAFIDFLLADLEGGVWRYRREPPIMRDLARIGLRSDDGIPFLAPELVLLYKSKNTSGKERRKDQSDFEATYARLEPERRVWLRWALSAVDPSHPWIQRLQ